ncbi:SKI family transcriptional corepressor 1 [Fukomys damarensis]|uniref:SKI family transcriptional corepressor 1 n=1 Tax=Fukomys damarensis TaxID=885580 RepID=UPI0014559E69|nr:SKI family transcriptional corepressor 1 [Fukomys damarensis]
MEALTTQLGPGREGSSSPNSKQELQPYSGSSALKPNQVGETSLYGVPIVSLVIDGQERLCLAQISNTLLKNYSYNEIHNRRVALGITCVQCTPVQLEILRRAGAMPISSRRCGMITKREAERLCKSFLGEHKPPKLPENFAFDVVHECAWGSRGSFIPARYNSSRAKCIKCGYCSMYFSPNKFIFHSHRTPDAKYTQPDAANFNSWRRHLKLSDKSATDELSHAWEDVKAMFNGGTRKRTFSLQGGGGGANGGSGGQGKGTGGGYVSPDFLSEGSSSYHSASPDVDTADEPEVDVESNRFPDEEGAQDETESRAPSAPSAGGGPDGDQSAGPPSATSSGADGPTDSPDDSSPRPRRRLGPPPGRSVFGDLAADDAVRRPERSPPSGGYELREPCGALGGPATAKASVQLPGCSPQAQPRLPGAGLAGSLGRWDRWFRKIPARWVGAVRGPEDLCALFCWCEWGEPGRNRQNPESARRLAARLGTPEAPVKLELRGTPGTGGAEKEPGPRKSGRAEAASPRTVPRHHHPKGRRLGCGLRRSIADRPGNLARSRCPSSCARWLGRPNRGSSGCIGVTVSLPLLETRFIAFKEPDKEDNHSTADDLETRKSYSDQRSVSQLSPANTDRGEDGLALDVTGTQLVEKDIENLAREELQKLLLEQMELRKKLEREFQSLKDNFQDQMKRELAYREEMVQQLQIVRDTLCNELDQERKARYAIQQKLKEAHDALHHFSCKMLTPRHCTGNCSFKPPLLP